jgi:anti-sigma B factor antagonist
MTARSPAEPIRPTGMEGPDPQPWVPTQMSGSTEVTATAIGPWSIVTAIGEFDFYSAPLLRTQLLDQIESGRHHLIVDMTGLTFLDSSALGVLVGALNRVRPLDGSVQLVIPTEQVLKIFRITGLLKVFPVHATLDEALNSRD